jgi:uncharacterized MAPEG superfamily protein
MVVTLNCFCQVKNDDNKKVNITSRQQFTKLSCTTTPITKLYINSFNKFRYYINSNYLVSLVTGKQTTATTCNIHMHTRIYWKQKDEFCAPW